ncbi:MAG: HAMP domain-containing sensor histidine kinase [Candidatus Thermoplasmatota archaeon]|nr:HAMP domain-containing sensor histidine kinase [Candidatus Thermoplasmatota archaeon]
MTDEGIDSKETLKILLDLLSHDINNHIHGSIGYIDLLEQTMPDDPMLKRFLGNSTSEIKAITPLVDNIRLLVNISREPFSGEKVDLIPMLMAAREVAKYQIGNKDLVIDTVLKEGDLIVKADRFLRDVFVQILSNSMKSDPSSEVHVEVKGTVENEKVMITFEDHGKGIPDSRKENIFTRFRRSIEKGDVNGKGMGLSVVREVTMRYGGMATLEDRVKGDHTQGIRVTLDLPLG